MSATDAILASLSADSLALGPHWVYDAAAIAAWYPGGIRDLDAPRSKYHPGKPAGAQTHYGDQTLLLLESLAASGGSLDRWADDWRAWAERVRLDGTSYFDGASRGTLHHMDAGETGPSESSDLGGASRIAPIFHFHLDTTSRVGLARQQTQLTHGDPRVADAAEFFARAGDAIDRGTDLPAALEEAASHPYDALPVIDHLAAARIAAEGEISEKAEDFGLGCDIDGAFPLTLALALRHHADPAKMLVTNAMLGGDSAARGLVLGFLSGLRPTGADLPGAWTRSLLCLPRVRSATGSGPEE